MQRLAQNITHKDLRSNMLNKKKMAFAQKAENRSSFLTLNGRPRTTLNLHLKERNLVRATTRSRYLYIKLATGFELTDISYIDKGNFKYCHKLILKKRNETLKLALLTPRPHNVVSMEREFAFYSKNQHIMNFPAVHELVHIDKDHSLRGHNIVKGNYILRDFIDAPSVSKFIDNKRIMRKYLYSIKSLMLKGIIVENEMDVSNINNAFYFEKEGIFKFIDHITGYGFGESPTLRLIRGLAGFEPTPYRDSLVKIFLPLPYFQKHYGKTLQEINEYWDIMDTLCW